MGVVWLVGWDCKPIFVTQKIIVISGTCVLYIHAVAEYQRSYNVRHCDFYDVM